MARLPTPGARARTSGGLTLGGRVPTIRAMDDDLQALQQRIERLLANARRLADENQRLRADLAASIDARRRLEGRMIEARQRVESALSRLPARGSDAPH